MSRAEIKKIEVNRQTLRRKAAARNIFSFTQLARLVPCSRTALYDSLLRPSRYPKVIRRIQELTE